MKMAILGPYESKVVYGGVAIFDCGLAQAFKDKGHDIILLGTQNTSDIKCNGFKYYKVNFHNINFILKSNKIDVVIGSLSYVKFFPIIKDVKKIYFIHGFFNWKHYSIVKSLLANYFQKKITKHSDLVLCNSSFTKTINEEIFNQHIDGVISLGVSSTFQNLFESNKIENKEKGSILFVGRLVDVKNVDKLIRSLKSLKNDYVLRIVGDGPELNTLKELALKYHINAIFLGKLNQKEIFELYNKSEIFISLNPTEPFGIVFLEALLTKCKIICPLTGGQLDILDNYKHMVRYVDVYNIESIGKKIDELLSIPISNYLEMNEIEQYKCTYLNTVDEIMNLIQE